VTWADHVIGWVVVVVERGLETGDGVDFVVCDLHIHEMWSGSLIG
jgi:hypothetical protein